MSLHQLVVVLSGVAAGLLLVAAYEVGYRIGSGRGILRNSPGDIGHGRELIGGLLGVASTGALIALPLVAGIFTPGPDGSLFLFAVVAGGLAYRLGAELHGRMRGDR
jgi:hypothetical protein